MKEEQEEMTRGTRWKGSQGWETSQAWVTRVSHGGELVVRAYSAFFSNKR